MDGLTGCRRFADRWTARRTLIAVALVAGGAIWLPGVSQMRFYGDDYSVLRTIQYAFPTWRDDFRVMNNGLWRPGIHLFFRMCYNLVGMSPPLYHYALWVIHILCAVLVWRVALRIGVAMRYAWLVPLVLLIHFAPWVAVLWPAAIGDSGSTLFILGGLLGYVGTAKRERPVLCWALTVAAGTGALFMKETGLLLISILLLYELFVERVWKSPRVLRQALFHLAPLAIVSLVYGVWMVWRILCAEQNYLNMGTFQLVGLHVPRNISDFVVSIFLPWPYRGAPPGLELLTGRNALLTARLAMLAALPLAVLFWWRRGDRISLWLVAWIVMASLVPSCSLSPPSSHFTYVATAGFAILFARIVGQIMESVRRPERRTARATAVSVIAVYLLLFAASDVFSPAVRHLVRTSREVETMAEELVAQAQRQPDCNRFVLIDPPLDGLEFYQNAIANVVAAIFLQDREVWVGVLRTNQVKQTVAGKQLPDDVRFFRCSRGRLTDVTKQVHELATNRREMDF